ncbi:MAG: hypothetical protein IIT48_00960 [Lachnospiraceae bacterium]|nr:hypothetical protein [Lachnospiraceae bacterium]
MRSYWSLIGNDKYSIGCTGQTVYLLNKQGIEIAKFKDLPYAYASGISPRGDLFVVKSTEGRLAVYSFSPAELITKFRYSKVGGSQDDDFCFSSDGKKFYNIERHIDSTITALSVYDTKSFSLIKRVLDKDYSCVLTSIEYDAETETVFLLGFYRDEAGIASEFFVGKLIDDKLNDVVRISEKEHDFYRDYLHLKMSGFTNKTFKWSYFDIELEKLKVSDYSLAKLWNNNSSERLP